jgi:hypothetical protein
MIRLGDYYSLLVSQFQQTVLPDVIQILLVLAFPALAALLITIFWPLWVNYVRSKNFLGIKYAVFEVKLPRDMHKSPKAMELLLHALHNTSDGNALKQYWNGETRPWYSLEIASFEGQVKFFIWGEEGRKIGLMSALYAQFPGIEVQQVEDYTKNTFFDPKTMKVWAAEFKLDKPDPYPIKTYIDYGLDKDPKEEHKVDPLVPGLEFLASVGANQQVWIQLIIRAHKKEQKKKGAWFWEKTDAWKDTAEKEINKIMRRDPKTKIAGAVDEEGKPKKEIENKFNLAPTLSDAEKDLVTALSRQISKLPFDVCIRTLYIAKKESFNTPFGIGGLISFFKSFNTENLNGFKPNGDKWMPWLDAPWKDFNDIRRNRFSREGLQSFKMRSAFYPPFDDGTRIILNSEELATVYHFPGAVAATPGLERVGSKKGEAPTNLPI